MLPFHVSRVSVWEGLRELKFLGLVESVLRRGTILKEMDFAMLIRLLGFQIVVSPVSKQQLQAARLAVKLGALELVCGKLTEEELHALKEIADCSRMDDSSEQLKWNYSRDCEFHSFLLHAVRNPELTAFSNLLEAFFKEICLVPIKASRDAAEDRLQLVKALEQGNLELPHEIMRLYLTKGMTGKQSKNK